IHCTYVPHPPSTALPCIPSRSWNPLFLFTSRASGDHLEFSPCLRPARPLDTPHIRSLQYRTTRIGTRAVISIITSQKTPDRHLYTFVSYHHPTSDQSPRRNRYPKLNGPLTLCVRARLNT